MPRKRRPTVEERAAAAKIGPTITEIVPAGGDVVVKVMLASGEKIIPGVRAEDVGTYQRFRELLANRLGLWLRWSPWDTDQAGWVAHVRRVWRPTKANLWTAEETP